MNLNVVQTTAAITIKIQSVSEPKSTNVNELDFQLASIQAHMQAEKENIYIL